MAQNFVWPKIILMITVHIYVAASKQECVSPQYLELGKSEAVICYFNDDVVSINWYFNLDVTEGPPTIRYINQVVSGEGYESGEFDIRQDGSLIINNVTIQHETRFTVYVVETNDDIPRRHDVDIVTIVPPDPPYPVFGRCASGRPLCYVAWKQATSLVCRIQRTRPVQHLTMVARTAEGDISIQTSTYILNHTNTWTSSISVTNPFMFSSYLALIICKAENRINLLIRNETAVLVQNKEIDMSPHEIGQVAVQRNHRMKLLCPEGDYQLLVWEKIYPTGDTTVVIAHVTTKGTISNETNGYVLEDGHLVIPEIKVHHEGLYRCTYSKDDKEVVKSSNVIVYVIPIPKFPIAEGCGPDRYCVLEVMYHGKLTCHVRGIRPEIKLEWRTYHEESQESISFYNQQLKTTFNGETSDITFTTEYTVKETSVKRLTLECRAVGHNAQFFSLNTQVDLLFSNMNYTTDGISGTTFINNERSTNIALNASFSVIVIFLVAVIVAGLLLCKVCKRRVTQPVLTSENEEHVPLMNNTDVKEKTLFVSQLKSTYRNLYGAIKPIPFFDDNCTVDELFVEERIEFLSRRVKKKWELLQSFKDMFTHPKLSHNHWIIEGGPGYGKSTHCLQLAYEWCHAVNGSFLQDIEIFILIRLRQLKGISSIYEAIKLFCLPKDTEITVDEIRCIISESTSLLIILDGFDEYPDGKVDEDSDVVKILKRSILPESRLVLTTRPLKFPIDVSPQANRLRLIGFHAEAQKEYLRKIVPSNVENSTEHTIQEWLEGNPVLRDLFEVPLFFVMYAHLSLEYDLLKGCTSVTSFFRYVITCLYAHFKRKHRDENVQIPTIDENDHHELDKFCFSKLNGHVYNPSMEKISLVKEFGEKVIDIYLRIGILREEESIEVCNEPEIQASQHVVNVTKIRLYHSLFCEWYAAHHLKQLLVDNITTNSKDNNTAILENLDHSKLQYVYRFACGISSTAANHILNYLKRDVRNKAFSILCILEQLGNVKAIMENVREVCTDTISIRNDDPMIIQKSVIKLLEIAVSAKLTFPKLVLVECFKSVNSLEDEIVLNSDVRLPVLGEVTCLWIEQPEVQLKEDDLDELFKYALKCRVLKEIGFIYSFVPFIFKQKSTLEQLREKEMKVLWYILDERLELDLNSGVWKKKAGVSEITKQEYNQMKNTFELMSN